MEKVLTKVMTYCNNHFVKEVLRGDFYISDGLLSLNKKPLKNAYIWLVGSHLNDGVYKIKDVFQDNDYKIRLDDVYDDKWTGAVCFLSVPRDFLDIVDNINKFEENQEQNKVNPLLKSESFEGYSYTLSTNQKGNILSWEDVHSKRLLKYKRMFKERVI